jgi:xanthine dehydrogenase accessory factor
MTPTLRELARDRPVPLATVTHTGTARNRFCADALSVELQVVDGRFAGLAWTGRACAVCEAAATLACRHLQGRAVEQRHVLAELLAGDPPGGEPFTPLRETLVAHPSRVPCARLVLDALEHALSPAAAVGATPDGRHVPIDDTWSAVRRWREAGDAVAVATLIDVVGSSPCPVGSHLVVAEDGRFWGAISGGCVEGAVVQAAVAMLAAPGTPQPRLATFTLANSQAGEVGLPCGGQITVHIGPAPGNRLLDRYARRGHGLARVIDTLTGEERVEPDPGGTARLEGDRYVEPLAPRDRLVLVGGTRIAQVLARLAGPMDFDVTVVEPRPGFATPDRFDVEVLIEAPDQALPALLGPRTAVVVLTHDARIDDEALAVALSCEAFYVGALGSRKTQRERIVRLEARGVPTARLHGPAGLPIGAVGASEIALSILAEVVQARRGRSTGTRVGVVVLAAGSSRRAGPVNKLLQPLDGEPLVRRTVRAALGARLGPCVVVLGHEADAVRAVLADLPVTFVVHGAHATGMGGSIGAGIAALAVREVTAAMVVLGDMPFCASATLAQLAAVHTPSTQHLPIVPVAGAGEGRRRGNPVIWPRQAFPALQALEGDTGARALLVRAGGAVLEVPVDDPGVLRDVDGVLP